MRSRAIGRVERTGDDPLRYDASSVQLRTGAMVFRMPDEGIDKRKRRLDPESEAKKEPALRAAFRMSRIEQVIDDLGRRNDEFSHSNRFDFVSPGTDDGLHGLIEFDLEEVFFRNGENDRTDRSRWNPNVVFHQIDERPHDRMFRQRRLRTVVNDVKSANGTHHQTVPPRTP